MELIDQNLQGEKTNTLPTQLTSEHQHEGRSHPGDCTNHAQRPTAWPERGGERVIGVDGRGALVCFPLGAVASTNPDEPGTTRVIAALTSERWEEMLTRARPLGTGIPAGQRLTPTRCLTPKREDAVDGPK